MALGDTLVFRGIRYPQASISGDLPVAKTKLFQSRLLLHTWNPNGNGRKWEATAPQGFWRDFADMDINAPDAVVEFIRRRGDPYGDRHTGLWGNLKSLLMAAAHAWEAEDDAGFSVPSSDKSRFRGASLFFGSEDIPIVRDLKVIPDPVGGGAFALEARSLVAYMAASAASELSRGVTMRRCRNCSSWFELARKDQLFCTASCRTQFSAKGTGNG